MVSLSPILMSDIPEEFRFNYDEELTLCDEKKIVSSNVRIVLYGSSNGYYTAQILRNDHEDDESSYYVIHTLDWELAKTFFDFLETREDRYIQYDPYRTSP
jgi:hypothetical protein